MTFFRQIQGLLERTYASVGVNFEECLISQGRCRELSARAHGASELSPAGRTFLRIVDGKLYVAIWYHPSIIRILEEHHPAMEMSEANIRALIVFLEELNHAVHAGLRFLEHRFDVDSEEMLADLELQAKIDTYLTLELLVSSLRHGKRLTIRHRTWLRTCLFESESFDYSSSTIRERYRSANRLGQRFIRHLHELPARKRVALIREWRNKDYLQKRSWIEALPAQ